MAEWLRKAIKTVITSIALAGSVGAGNVCVLPNLAEARIRDNFDSINQDYARARKLYDTGHYDEAIDELKQISNRYRVLIKGIEDYNYSVIIGLLARAYYEKGRYAEAEPLFERVLALREKAQGPNSPDVASSLDDLASLYDTLGHYADAEPLYKRALAIRESALGPDHLNVAVSLNNLATTYQSQGRYSDAEPLYKRALAIEEKAQGPDHPDVATCLNNLGGLYEEEGRYADAEPLYKRALAIRETALGPQHHDVAVSLYNLAHFYEAQGRYGEAEPLYKRAIAIDEKVLGPEHPNVALKLNKLADLYDELGRYADAEPLDKRALAISEKALGPDHRDVADRLNSLAILYDEQGRSADAEPLYKRALAIYEKTLGPDHHYVAATLNNLAALYYAQKRYADAEPLYERALAITEKALGPAHPEAASYLANLAGLYDQRGRFAEAEQLYKRSLTILEEALGPNRPQIGKALNNFASHYDRQSRFADALPLVRTASGRGFVDGPVYLYALDGARGVGLLAEADAVGESFSVVQQASSSAASDALGQLAVRFAAGSGDLAGLVRREQDLVAANDRLDKSLIAEISKAPADRDKDKEQALRNDLDQTAKSLNDVRTELGSRFPDYVALSRPQTIALADTQALLGNDEALMVIDLAAPGVEGDEYVWALTRHSATWKKLSTKTGEIADEVAILRSQLNPHGNKPFDPELAYRLYKQIFTPIENAIAGKHQLLLVLSGALTSLPPQVLISADPAGKNLKSYDWLIRHFSVTVLPSVSSLKVLASANAKSGAAKPMTGYGDPVFKPGDPQNGEAAGRVPNRDYGYYYRGGLVADVDALRRGLPALPETAAELLAVAKSVGAGQGDIKLGSAATVTAVKLAPLDQYRIIYFATHALVAGEVEAFAKIKAEPALALSLPDRPTERDDGLLKASEVAQLKLDADIVVLSACNTAAGDKPGAEALSGLARAFFYAGARSLIVSHWPVESDATVRLMTSTFAETTADKALTLSEALRKSELAMIDDPRNPHDANPSSWAPFIVVGGNRATR